MPIEIHGDNADPIIRQLHQAIEAAVDCDEIQIGCGSPGHFTIRVVSSEFEGLSRVKQQQLVYAAIAPLMAGNQAPVHAVDRLDCVKA